MTFRGVHDYKHVEEPTREALGEMAAGMPGGRNPVPATAGSIIALMPIWDGS